MGTRLRVSTRGSGYDIEDLRAGIAEERSMLELPDEDPPPQNIDLIIDIQERLQSGKGPDFERWAKVYNLKQVAAALQFLQEHKLTDYPHIAARTEAVVDCFHCLGKELQQAAADFTKLPN